jgi:hypothetical protein
LEYVQIIKVFMWHHRCWCQQCNQGNNTSSTGIQGHCCNNMFHKWPWFNYCNVFRQWPSLTLLQHRATAMTSGHGGCPVPRKNVAHMDGPIRPLSHWGDAILSLKKITLQSPTGRTFSSQWRSPTSATTMRWRFNLQTTDPSFSSLCYVSPSKVSVHCCIIFTGHLVSNWLKISCFDVRK